MVQGLSRPGLDQRRVAHRWRPRHADDDPVGHGYGRVPGIAADGEAVSRTRRVAVFRQGSPHRSRSTHLRLHRDAGADRAAEGQTCMNVASSTDAASSPRLLVRDTLGQRMIPLDKPLVTLGRRSETDVRVPGAGVSRVHAEIVTENGVFRLRDCASRFGTFVHGERTNERVLAHGDRIKLGQSDDTEIIFFIGDDAPSQERSSVAAVSEIRHMAGLLEGLRALGSGRVLDDVLTLVIDSAIEVTGAERGFIMLAGEGQLEFKLARARGKLTLSGKTFATSRKIPETVFATGREAIVEDLLDGDLAQLHTGTVALGIRHVLCTPLRLVRYVERAEESTEDKMIGVLYLDSRERGALRSAAARAALDTLSTEAAVAIENARLYREALDRAKLDQELKVAAGIQRSLLPVAGVSGKFFTVAGASVPCRAVEIGRASCRERVEI